MLEQRLTQRVLFILPCQPNSKGRKHFPKWFILNTLSHTRDSHGIGHWGSEFTGKCSKFLLFLPSIVTSLHFDSDKESSSRKKTTSKGKKGLNNNSILTILSTGNMSILRIQKKCVEAQLDKKEKCNFFLNSFKWQKSFMGIQKGAIFESKTLLLF